MTNAEKIVYGGGILALIGALVFRKRLETAGGKSVIGLPIIFGTGMLLTGGAMTIYRRRTLPALNGLGMTNTETVQGDGKTLRVWDDRTMGIKDRVWLLQGLVARSVKQPEMRSLALAITGSGTRNVQVGKENLRVVGAGCPGRDDECEARAIFDWVAKNIRYTGDVGPHALKPGGPVEAVDQFQAAGRTIEFRGGDCDDHAVLSATLAAQNGFPPKFRITSNTGDSWDHIYTMVGVPKLDPKHWIALDTTLGDPGHGKTTGKFNKQPKRAKQADFAA